MQGKPWIRAGRAPIPGKRAAEILEACGSLEDYLKPGIPQALSQVRRLRKGSFE
jgi:hypothetical protein